MGFFVAAFIKSARSLHPTPVVELRPLDESDAPVFLKLIENNRDHLRTWGCDYDSIFSVCDIKDLIEESRIASEEGLHVEFGIFLNGITLVGILQIYPDHQNGAFALGYWVDHDHEGLGIASEACRQAIEYLFESEVPHAIIRCHENNYRSAALAERLGFTFKRVLSGQRDHFDDHRNELLFSLPRKNWLIRKNPAYLVA